MPLDTDRLKKFARLYLARKKLDAKSSQIGKELEKMMPALIDHMIDEETDKVSFKGGITLRIQPQIWAKYDDRKEAIEALKEAGLTDMVEEGFNAQTLASYLRELNAAGEDLPEAFKGKIEANTVQKLIAKKY